MSQGIVRIDGRRVTETDMAVLVEIFEGEPTWLPLSAVDSMHFDKDGEGHLMIAEWLAKKRGLV